MTNLALHVSQYVHEHPPAPHEMQALQYLFCRGNTGTSATSDRMKTFMVYLRKDVVLLSYKRDSDLFAIFLLHLLPWACTQSWKEDILMDRVCSHWFGAMEKMAAKPEDRRNQVMLERHANHLSDAIRVLTVHMQSCGNVVQRRAIDAWMAQFRACQPTWLVRDADPSANSTDNAHAQAWVFLVQLLQEHYPQEFNSFIRVFGKATYRTPSSTCHKTYMLAFLKSDLPIDVKCRLASEAFNWSLWLDDDVHALLQSKLPSSMHERYALMPYFHGDRVHSSVKSLFDKVKLHESIVMLYCPQLRPLYSMLFEVPLDFMQHPNPRETVLSYLKEQDTWEVGTLLE